MDADTSNCSDSICSDDTEYLLGQNVSFREIDDYENQSDSENIAKCVRGQNTPRTHSIQAIYNTKLSPPRKGQREKAKSLVSPQKQIYKDNYSSVDRCHETTDTFVDHQRIIRKTDDVQKENRRNTSKTEEQQASEFGDRARRERVLKNAGQLQNESSKKSYKYSSYVQTSDVYERHIGSGTETDSVLRKSSHQKKGPELDYSYEQRTMSSPFSPPTKDHDGPSKKNQKSGTGASKREFALSRTQDTCSWEADSDVSVDAVTNHHGALEHNDLVSEMSDATEDLVGVSGEEELDAEVAEKLKKLNLAVNYDAETDGKFAFNVHLMGNSSNNSQG